MRDREPTVRARELGEGLRQAMHRASVSASQIARQLGWSPSRVSRLLSGKRGGSEQDVLLFMAVCGVKGKERDRLMALAREQHRRNWLQQHCDRPTLRTLVDQETKATRIGDFQLTVINGLLQTERYARALMFEAGIVPVEEIDRRVSARLRRQNMLQRPYPPRCTFFMHEFVLRLPIGGREVMSDQLHQLLRMSVRPNITLRVIPAERGAHAGINGSFTFIEFADFTPVIYLDTRTSNVFLETPEEVKAYRAILATLENTALDDQQSTELIANLAVELYSGIEDYHALD